MASQVAALRSNTRRAQTLFVPRNQTKPSSVSPPVMKLSTKVGTVRSLISSAHSYKEMWLQAVLAHRHRDKSRLVLCLNK